ncbi:MAG: hypothetical protein ACREEA_06525 [Stellaceae bacterium]
MKNAILWLFAVLLLALPARARAQYSDSDRLDPDEYRDVDNGQFLQFGAYVLTPIGMGLEWGMMRPLHHLATRTAIAPLLSGDKEHIQFGQNHNADLAPPGTFRPAPMNLTNQFVPAPPETGPLTTTIAPSPPELGPSLPRGQAVLH